MKPSEIIRAAMKLIDTPEKWCKGALAVDASGRALGGIYHENRQQVCRMCAEGAIECARFDLGVPLTGKYEEDPLFAVVAKAASPKRKRYLWVWQDAPRRRHAEVLSALSRAAEALEGSGE